MHGPTSERIPNINFLAKAKNTKCEKVHRVPTNSLIGNEVCITVKPVCKLNMSVN